MVGEDTLLRFGGVPLGEACTIVIRGATQQILDEAERSIHDALCVLAATVRESRIVYGGGKHPQSLLGQLDSHTDYSNKEFNFASNSIFAVDNFMLFGNFNPHSSAKL